MRPEAAADVRSDAAACLKPIERLEPKRLKCTGCKQKLYTHDQYCAACGVANVQFDVQALAIHRAGQRAGWLDARPDRFKPEDVPPAASSRHVGDLLAELRRREAAPPPLPPPLPAPDTHVASSSAGPVRRATQDALSAVPTKKAKVAESDEARASREKRELERKELERKFKPDKPWSCPRKKCGQVNPRHIFICLSCGLDGLTFGRCQRVLGLHRCLNKQVLLAGNCLKCGSKWQVE